MIPNEGHFVWFGPTFPFTHALAIRSLWLTNQPSAIHLYLSDDLTGQPHFDALRAEVSALRIHGTGFDELTEGWTSNATSCGRPGIRCWPSVALPRCRTLSATWCCTDRAGSIWISTPSPCATWRRCGAAPGFCGREAILVPGALERRSKVLRRFRNRPAARGPAGLRKLPRRRTLVQAHRAPLRAVHQRRGAGSAGGHRVTRQALSHVPALHREVGRRRPRIGPDLLQDLIEGCDDVAVLPPAAFYR